MENTPSKLQKTNDLLRRLREKDINALNEGHFVGAFTEEDTDVNTFDTERRTKITSVKGYAEILLHGGDVKKFGTEEEWKVFLEEVAKAVEDGILDETEGYHFSAINHEIASRLRE